MTMENEPKARESTPPSSTPPLSLRVTVTVAVPVSFINEDAAPGIKRDGGVLNVVTHELELTVEASNIPTEIVVDLTGREVGDSIHLSDVKLPNGAETAADAETVTVATITQPTTLTAEDEALDAEVAEAQSAEAADEAEGEDKAEG